MRQLAQAFHWEVLTAYELTMLAVTQKNESAAHRCAATKSTINSLARKADEYQASRLVSDDSNLVGSYAFETDFATSSASTGSRGVPLALPYLWPNASRTRTGVGAYDTLSGR